MPDPSRPFSRRAVLSRGTLLLTGLGLSKVLAADASVKPALRIGLVTDIHYADKEPTSTRFFREALGKLGEAVRHMNREKPDFVVSLGDMVDSAPSVEEEIAWLQTVEKQFARLAMPRHYVLGNHCVWTLTKEEFSAHTGMPQTTYNAHDQGGWRFLFLDGCFRKDGQPYQRHNADWRESLIPEAEMRWLEKQLSSATGPVIVFAHQRLDEKGVLSSLNAPEVRQLLEKSGKVVAVLQGHSHQNDYQHIQGIHYCTLVAQIEGTGLENSGYAILDILPDSSLRLHGFRRQENYSWPA